MHSQPLRLVLLSTVAAVVVLITIGVNGADDVPAEKSCKATLQELSKKQLGGITECTKKLKFKNGKDKAKKMTCVMKCILKKEGILNPEGQMSLESFNQFNEAQFHPNLRPIVIKAFKPCLEIAMAKKLDDEDEFCKDYDPFVKCLMTNMPNMCN